MSLYLHVKIPMAGKEANRRMRSRSLSHHLTLQCTFFIFSLAVLSMKYASNFAFGSTDFLRYYLFSLFFMASYAFFWQKVLAVFPLTRAYCWKSLVFVWVFVFSIFVFKESVSWANITGAFLIVSGAIMVNSSE